MDKWMAWIVWWAGLIGCLAVPVWAVETVLPSGGAVILSLRDGGRVEGELLRSTDSEHVLWLGGRAVSFAVGDVLSIGARGETAVGGTVLAGQRGLYTVGGGREASIQELARQYGHGVVMVRTPRGAGTGWFVHRDGYVLTNCHVIQREQAISITVYDERGDGFGNRVYRKVRIVALSDDIDLALLKIEEPLDFEVPVFSLAVADEVAVGERCFTIGNPLGLERSTSAGEISANARQIAGRLFLQTTAPIAPGNSGGPLLNTRGEVIGVINSGAVVLDGIGFAIPVRYIKEFLDHLEAFAFDADNPNNGLQYMRPPVVAVDGQPSFGEVDFILTGFGASNLVLADVDGDGAAELISVFNAKSEIRLCRHVGERGAAGARREDDYEDVNRLDESRWFVSRSLPVRSRIFSLAAGDVTGDGRVDLVYAGDVEGLAAMVQKEDGEFSDAEKIATVDVGQRSQAIAIRDLDGDGRNEVVVLGQQVLSVFAGGAGAWSRRDYPLAGPVRARLSRFELLDVDGDGRLDIVLLVDDRFHCLRVRLQSASGEFDLEQVVRGNLAGPVELFRDGVGGSHFVALDKGMNRVRRLSPVSGEQSGVRQPRFAALALPMDASEASGNALFDLLPGLDGEGVELLVRDSHKNEFVLGRLGPAGLTSVRSPSPRRVANMRLYRDQLGRKAVFCLSREDRLLGVAKVEEDGRIAFPRPLDSEGEVQLMELASLLVDGQRVAMLLWVEKRQSGHVFCQAPADQLVAAVHAEGEGGLSGLDETLRFELAAGEELCEVFERRPAEWVVADVDADGNSDLIVYWSYSGRESVLLKREGRYVAAIHDQDVLADLAEQPLLAVDLDGDGHEEVLQVHAEFGRVLKLDGGNRLYVARQLNWSFGALTQLVPIDGQPGADGARFLGLDGTKARWLSLATGAGTAVVDDEWDLSGLALGRAVVVDVDGDGRDDVVAAIAGGIQVLQGCPPRLAWESTVLLDERLDDRLYWRIATGNLRSGGGDQIFLFDAQRSMMEIGELEAPGGGWRRLLRHRLVERGIFQVGGEQNYEVPQDFAVADVDGDGRADLVFNLGDRLAVYFQR